MASKFIKREVLKTQRAYSEEFNHMGRGDSLRLVL